MERGILGYLRQYYLLKFSNFVSLVCDFALVSHFIIKKVKVFIHFIRFYTWVRNMVLACRKFEIQSSCVHCSTLVRPYLVYYLNDLIICVLYAIWLFPCGIRGRGFQSSQGCKCNFPVHCKCLQGFTGCLQVFPVIYMEKGCMNHRETSQRERLCMLCGNPVIFTDCGNILELGFSMQTVNTAGFSHNIPYARHYNPQFVSFLPTF